MSEPQVPLPEPQRNAISWPLSGTYPMANLETSAAVSVADTLKVLLENQKENIAFVRHYEDVRFKRHVGRTVDRRITFRHATKSNIQ